MRARWWLAAPRLAAACAGARPIDYVFDVTPLREVRSQDFPAAPKLVDDFLATTTDLTLLAG